MEQKRKLKYKYDHTEVKPVEEEKPKEKSNYEKLREAHKFIDEGGLDK